jgi:hypothetical protein
VDQEREPAFEDNWRVFDSVIAYTRDLVGPSGTEVLGYIHGGGSASSMSNPSTPARDAST